MGTRAKMSRAERAKQFMPFDPLKGYREALHEKEKIRVPKAELTEEAKEELDFKLHQIQKNDMVSVIYYCDEEYLKIAGMVSRMDITAKLLKIVNTRIPFEDIIKIEML